MDLHYNSQQDGVQSPEMERAGEGVGVEEDARGARGQVEANTGGCTIVSVPGTGHIIANMVSTKAGLVLSHGAGLLAELVACVFVCADEKRPAGGRTAS